VRSKAAPIYFLLRQALVGWNFGEFCALSLERTGKTAFPEKVT